MANVNLQLEHKPLTWWIGVRSFKWLKDDIRGNWLDRVIIGVNMARIAWQLHSNGLCHSDFSGDNFLANVANQHAVLIDLDSLVVPGVLPPEMLGTGRLHGPGDRHGRSHPESGANRPSRRFTLPVGAIYQLLLMRHRSKAPSRPHDAEKDDLLALGQRALYIEDTQDRSNRPPDPFRGAWLLGDEVEALMRRRLPLGCGIPVSGPGGAVGRRAAAIWRNRPCRVPTRSVKGKPCPATRPACDLSLVSDEGRAACAGSGVTPVRLARGKQSHFQPGRGRVVVGKNRTLHRWHIQAGYSASRPDDRSPVAEFRYKQSKWMLENVAIPELRVASRSGVTQVPISESFTLENGQQLILGVGQSARLGARLHAEAVTCRWRRWRNCARHF